MLMEQNLPEEKSWLLPLLLECGKAPFAYAETSRE